MRKIKNFVKKSLKIKNVERVFFVGMLIMLLASALVQPVLAQNFNASQDSTIYGNSAYSCNLGLCIVDGQTNSLITDGACDNNVLVGAGVEIIDSINKIVSLQGRDTICAVANLENGDTAVFNKVFAQRSSTNLLEAVSGVTSLMMRERPASGIDYISDKAYAVLNLGVQSASAQDDDGPPPSLYYRGTGFSLLRPVQAFWGWSVNIVYGILIFIIIGVAFGIMFRSSLSGELAVTLQNAIPNIALAMILVPLSYAITGLFIDGITVGVNVVHEFLLGAGAPGRGVYENRDTDYPLDRLLGNTNMEDRGLHADDIRVTWLYSGSALGITDEISTAAESTSVIFGVNTALHSLFQGAADFLAPFINFVIGIILLFTGVRIFWILFQKFIVFILGPLFSPFIFATVAIPGNGTKAVMAYLKFMGSGTLHYVVAYFMIVLAIIFSSPYFQTQLAGIGTTGFVPPLIGLEDLLGGLSSGGVPTGLPGFYMGLIALGIYLMIPSTLKKIDTALGADQGFPLLGEIFQSAQDSISLGKKTGSLAINLPTKYRTQAWQSAQNLADRLRGRRPGEEGTYLARRRARMQSKLTSLEQQRRAAVESGNDVKAAYLATRIAQVQSGIGGVDTSLGGDGKTTEGPNELAAEIAWIGQKSLLVIDGTFANTIRDQGGVFMGGSLTIKSKTPFYPDKYKYGKGAGKEIDRRDFVIQCKHPQGSTVTFGPGLEKNDGDTINWTGNPGDEPIFVIEGDRGGQASQTHKDILAYVYVVGIPTIEPDGMTVKFGLSFNVTIDPGEFMELSKLNRFYKAVNEIKVLVNGRALGFGANVSAPIVETNRVTFNIQHAVANTPGMQDNPAYNI